MDRDQERARRRAEEDRDLFAIRREERAMAATERELERRLDAEASEEREVERKIEAEWRVEDWGQDPPRPPAWRVRPTKRPPPGDRSDA